MNQERKINDFVIRFADVNRNTSASGSVLFATAVFRKCIRVTLLLTFTLLTVLSASAQDGVKITLANSTEAEKQTKGQLERLLNTYELSKWIITKSIVIDEKKVIPHSHPVLTLTTRHLKDDELLVSTFVHEQMHWFLMRDQKRHGAVVKDLREMFPKVPVGNPDGAGSEDSTYIHIAVNYLEYRAMRELMGELRSKQIMEFWATDHYTWIYKTVLERPRDIGTLMFKHNMIPLEAKPMSPTAE